MRQKLREALAGLLNGREQPKGQLRQVDNPSQIKTQGGYCRSRPLSSLRLLMTTRQAGVPNLRFRVPPPLREIRKNDTLINRLILATNEAVRSLASIFRPPTSR